MALHQRSSTHHRAVAANPPMGHIKRPAPKPHRTTPLPGWKPETARARSRVPVIAIAAVAILLVAIIGKLLLGFVANHGVHFERARLMARTQAVASSLDVGQIKALTGRPADEDSSAFKALVTRLSAVRTAHRDVRFSYLMGWNGSAVVFLLDSTNPGSSDYSPPGQVFEEASPELLRSFTLGEPFVEGPVTDRWGTWVSGLAPIRDPSSGQVIAVMGMDVDATRWKVTLASTRVIAYLIVGLLLGIVVFFARRVRELR